MWYSTIARTNVTNTSCATGYTNARIPILWRIETYCGVKMTQIGFLEFWEFMWRERRDLWRFLKWTGEMERHVHPNPKSS